MVMLASLEQVSQHIRRDTDADDEDVIKKIKAASSIILNYIDGNADFLDSSGEVDYDST